MTCSARGRRRPTGPGTGCPARCGDLLDVPEPYFVTVRLLTAPVRLGCPSFQAAQPRHQRAAPDPHPAARQPHDRGPGPLPAPAVERVPRYPQLGGHLLDRQQRVIRGSRVLAKQVRPHTLRHAFITAALDAGVPLRDVQEAASHADPRTTMRYDRARASLDRHATYIVATYTARQAR